MTLLKRFAEMGRDEVTMQRRHEKARPFAFSADERPSSLEATGLVLDKFAQHFGARRDVARRYSTIAEPSKDFVIFMTPESGSTWLAEILKRHGGFGEPEEWFNADHMRVNIDYMQSSSLDRYIHHIRKAKSDPETGLFGVTVSFGQLEFVEALASFFNAFDRQRTQFFYLSRRDVVAQTVSLHEVQRRLIDSEETYDEGQLVHWMEHLLQQEAAFERMFEATSLQPTRLLYEDLVEAGANAVCQFFGECLGVKFKGVSERTVNDLRAAHDESVAARLATSLNFQWLRERSLRPAVGLPRFTTATSREAVVASSGVATALQRKIFILGDSRTGTKSLANYFRRNGLQSLHYYMAEAQQLSPPHEHHEENWRRFKAFLETSSAQAFSDYPTRSFFRELFDERPDDYFILTTRKDTPTWKRSMDRFFGLIEMNLNLDELAQHYENNNEAILALYGKSRKFLHICIDDDSQQNSAKLAEFLGLDPSIMIARENRSTTLNTMVLSKRGDFFGQPVGDVVNHVKLACRDSITMPSSTGWLYLINDSSSFIDHLYGRKQWSASERDRALQIVSEHSQSVSRQGARYKKFIVPEKHVIYPEHLPSLLSTLSFASNRPALELGRHDDVLYLDEYLLDAKSHGKLYFRTATNPTWLGGFFIYRRIIEELARRGDPRLGSPLPLGVLAARLGGYEGDLLKQMRDDQLKELDDIWRPYFPEGFRDHDIVYTLTEEARKARRVDTPREYLETFETGEVLVFEQDVPTGPRAVVFRDSTADFSVNLLAEHFSRSVFVWKEGPVLNHALAREKPDYVIHVMAERFVSLYPGHVAVTDGVPVRDTRVLQYS